MKSFSKLFLAVVGLTLAGCAAATTEAPVETKGPVLTPLPLTFEGAVDATNWSVAAGYQNGATVGPLSASTTYSGDQSAGGRTYTYNSPAAGNKFWPDPVGLGTQMLKFNLRTDDALANGGSHVVVTFLNLDFGSMTGKTGVEFVLRLPSGPNKVGLSPILRYNDGKGTATSENTAVYTAPLNEPESENFSVSGSVYDWVYFGDKDYLHFKVPFACFSVPGWAPAAAKVNTTIASALAAGVKFNEFNLDFRMDTTDADGGAVNTDYPVYLDNVKLY